MMRKLLLPLAVLAVLPFLRSLFEPHSIQAGTMADAYQVPLPKPAGPLKVYHLGHSLVGRNMPAMLAQLAGQGHHYDSQLGWGTSLKEHWKGGKVIKGFETENDHARYRDARTAIGSGDYDAIVLTEMVELKDAIKYHQSGKHLSRWADLSRNARPDTRIYLYETWHKLNDPDGWLERLDADLPALWEEQLLAADLARNGTASPVYVIPAGQVMARFVREVDAQGGVGNVRNRESLFARDASGALDPIHVNDLGAYLVALTHYAVLYHQSPEGLPHQLMRADGARADAPSADAAALMQSIVWQVVAAYDKTGVAQ